MEKFFSPSNQKIFISLSDTLKNKMYLSRRELSEILGISLSSVARGYKAGIFPFNKFIKIGERLIFPISFLPYFFQMDEVHANE